VNEAGVVLFVERAAVVVVAQGLPLAPYDSACPHSYFVIHIIVLIVGRRELRGGVVYVVVLKVDIYVSIEIRIGVGEPWTRLRTPFCDFLFIIIILACLTGREGGTGYFSKAVVAHLAPLPASSLGGGGSHLAGYLIFFLVSLICRLAVGSSICSPILIPQERTRLLLPPGPRRLLRIIDLFTFP